MLYYMCMYIYTVSEGIQVDGCRSPGWKFIGDVGDVSAWYI